MSRTPLFRLIQRSYRAASYSITHAEPVDELLDRRDESRLARLAARDGMSRRQFVAGGAAVAAVAVLDACAPRLPSGGVTPRPDQGGSPVLIIGAGIAGLTAGYRLRSVGVPIRIIEAQNRVGGRMFSLRNFFADGQVCELGGELIDTNQTHIQSLAQELGIPLDDLSKDDAVVKDMFYFDGAPHSERDVVDAFVPVARQVGAALATLGPDIGYRTATPAAIALDRMTITQWLDKAGVAVR
jgi:monoamine oxidase